MMDEIVYGHMFLIVPSWTIVSNIGQAWVFRITIKDIFPIIFGKTTVERNRLKLTDEDPSEYATMEKLIITTNEYSQLTVMLCVFHAIWGPFKDLIRPHLPSKGNLITPLGKAYGDNRY